MLNFVATIKSNPLVIGQEYICALQKNNDKGYSTIACYSLTQYHREVQQLPFISSVECITDSTLDEQSLGAIWLGSYILPCHPEIENTALVRHQTIHKQ